MLSEQRAKAIKLAYEGFMAETVAEKCHISTNTLVSSWGIKIREIRRQKREGMTLAELLQSFESKPSAHEKRLEETLLRLEERKKMRPITSHNPQNTKVMVSVDRLEEVNDKLDKILEFVAKF